MFHYNRQKYRNVHQKGQNNHQITLNVQESNNQHFW